MLSLLVRWLLLTLSVWVATFIVPGIGYDDWQSLVVAALVLGILNSVLRPLLILLSLPFVVVTFGLFLVVINAFLLVLTGYLVKGFHVASFWSALGAAVIISVVSLVLNRNGRRARTGGTVHGHGRRGPPPGKGPVIDVKPQ